MFEIKKPEMANRTIRISRELLDRLETTAQQKGISVNNLISQCCEYALDNLKNEDA